MGIGMPVLWLVVAVACLIIEGLTVGLFTIWFTAGALAALVAALLHANVFLQVAIFLLVSLCLLFFTRKIFVGKLHTGAKKTNVDALVGSEGLVTADIAPFAPGQVKLQGQVWTAVAPDEETRIAAGTAVRVQAISGVKLIVTAQPQEAPAQVGSSCATPAGGADSADMGK